MPRPALLLLFVLTSLGACAPTVVPMGPPVTAPQLIDSVRTDGASSDDHIVAADGTRLPLRIWRAEDKPPRAVILAVHGFNDYSLAFEDAAKDWQTAGIVTYAYDQRGFGKAPERGLWVGTETLVSDLETAVKLIKQRHPDLPLYVLGESMGGAVVLVAGAEHRLPGVAGTILVAPAVRGRETFNGVASATLWFFAHTIPWLAGQPGGRPLFLPSDNIPMLRRYSRDPLVIKDTRIDTFYGLVGLMDDALTAARSYDLPALILLGAKDDLIPGAPSDLMLSRMPPAAAARRRLAVYPKGYHMLLRDLEAELAIHDVAFWALDPASAQPLPSGDERPISDYIRTAKAAD